MYSNYILSSQFNAGIYIRLSQEDRDKSYESDSESIINQRNLLLDYVKNNNFNLFDEYVDDGYSGTNFDRPGFKRLLEDIKKKKINLVIVKDLSRLGRDHVMTGYYMENYFPENKIRFISILESYDSFKDQASNDSSTFIVACNDYYSKQNSIKIKNVLNEKRRKGKFIGSLPCFGYMRDPEDKGHLIPNPETDYIVKEIFNLSSNGVGVSEIVTILNEKKYPTPSGYKQTKFSTRLVIRDVWNISSVNKILKNRIYTGDMVQHVQAKVSYKSKKKVNLDQSLWVIVEDTHEPLVSKEVFKLVNDRKHLKNKTYKKVTGRDIRLFEGLIYCKECGNRLTVTYRKNLDYWSVNCNRYSRDPKRRRCEPHFFPYDYLEEQLIKKLNEVLGNYLKLFNVKDLNKEICERETSITSAYKEKIKTLESKKKKTISKITQLYDDRFEGVITANIYATLVEPLENELKQIDNEIESNKEIISVEKKNLSKIPDYTEKIKELLNLNTPKRELLLALIDRIEIDKDKVINIKFKFNVIEEISFKYEDKQGPRNPYGKRGKVSIN